jgi:hypothetical protein
MIAILGFLPFIFLLIMVLGAIYGIFAVIVMGLTGVDILPDSNAETAKKQQRARVQNRVQEQLMFEEAMGQRTSTQVVFEKPYRRQRKQWTAQS